MERSKRNKLKKNLFVYSLIAYPLILFLIFYVVVNFNSILLAFQTIDGSGKSFAGLNNFKTFLSEMFGEGNLLSYSFINSIKMYFINLVVCMPLYVFFSYLLFKKCFLNKTVSFLVMIPSIMSGLVIALIFVNFIGSNGPLTFIMERTGWNGGKWLNLLYDEKYAFGTTLFYMIWLSFATSLIVYPILGQGATTLWESFEEYERKEGELQRKDGVKRIPSFNHHFWGGVLAWIYRYIGWLDIKSEDTIEISPTMIEGVNRAEIEYSRNGKSVAISWRRTNEKLQLKVNSLGFKCILKHGGKTILPNGDSRFEFTIK